MTESAATSLEAVSVFLALLGGHIGDGMTFDTLLRTVLRVFLKLLNKVVTTKNKTRYDVTFFIGICL